MNPKMLAEMLGTDEARICNLRYRFCPKTRRKNLDAFEVAVICQHFLNSRIGEMRRQMRWTHKRYVEKSVV